MINIETLYKISYGLYIVSSGDRSNGNGFISNTVFQVSSNPPQFAVCCNKNNYTADFIQKYQNFSVSILAQTATADVFGKFGFKSGKDFDKMKDTKVMYGQTGVPIVLNESIAYFECTVLQTIDVGTHLMFIGEMVNAELTDIIQEPLTYAYYRQVKKGIAPKNAPTYIDKSIVENISQKSNVKKYKCSACGYIYDESIESIKFNELPDDWVCPACGSEKSDFIELE